MIDPSAYVDAAARVDASIEVGARSRIWQFATVIRGTKLGADCNVQPGAVLDGPTFGDRCIVCMGVAMGPGFLFGDDCFVGPNATVCNDRWPRPGKDGFDADAYRSGHWAVIVEDGASIGANAVVLPGRRICRDAVVAAGAVVERDVPPGHLLTRGGEIVRVPLDRRCNRMASIGGAGHGVSQC